MTTPASESSETAGVVETLKNDLGRLKQEVQNLAADAVHLPKDAILGDLENSVRRQPLKSLAIAAGVGVVVVMVLRR